MSEVRWARVRIVCKVHPDQVLVEWSTFDGKIANADVRRAASPSTYQLQRVGFEEGVTWSREPIADADEPHWKHVLRCGKPSCNYGPEFGEESAAALARLALALWHEGTPLHVVDDLDDLLRRAGPD